LQSSGLPQMIWYSFGPDMVSCGEDYSASLYRTAQLRLVSTLQDTQHSLNED
jgi:hypothetical protein